MATWIGRLKIAQCRQTGKRLALAAVLAASLTATVLAQSAARPDKGVRPTGSYAVSDIENVNMTNGNLNVSIPLASLPPIAGGKLSRSISAVYNSKTWDMYRVEEEDSSTIPPTRFITNHLQLSAVNPWFIGGGYRIDVAESRSDTDWRDPFCTIDRNPCDPDYDLMQQHSSWYKVSLTTPDGAVHELRPLDGGGDYPNFNRDYLLRYSWKTPATTNATMTYYSYDGSYLWAAIQPFTGQTPLNWDVYLPDGTRIKNRDTGAQWIIDTNSNKIKIQSDTVGTVTTTYFRDLQTSREIRYVFDQSTNPPFGQGRVEYQAVGGTWVSILINFRATFVNGWAYAVDDPNCERADLISNTDITVVDSIVVPQTEPNITRQFSFGYSSDVSVPADYYCRTVCGAQQQHITSMSRGLGSLSRMTMPSGAVVNYSYLEDQPTTGSTITFPVDPTDLPGDALIKKEVQHDSLTDVWNYSACLAGNSGMSAPDGSVVTENSYPHNRAFQFTYGGLDGKGGLTYRTTQSNRVVVERKWRFNSLNGMPAGSTGSSQLVPFNPVVDIEFTTLDDPPGTPSKMSAKQFQYDLNGNVTSETDYDWIDLSQVTVPRDAQGVPTSFPGTVMLRTFSNSYYNDSTSQTSPNVYHKRVNGDPPSPLILNAPRLTTVGPSQTEFHYDGIDNTPPSKGNLTKQRHWEGTKWIETTHTYDAITGNLTSTTDPKNNVTQFFYDATQALPSSVVVDPNNQVTGDELTTQTAYDFASGLPTSVTDPNGRTTSSVYTNQLLGTVDPFGRAGVVTDPQGRKAVTRYFDNARQVEVWSDLNSASDALLKSRTSSDQLGRVVKTESSEDGSTYTLITDTAYEQMGRITYTSNPHRSGAASTDGWTRASRDEVGRVVEIATFDGVTKPTATATTWNGRVQTSYSAEQATVTDQAGKQRKSVVDGLGRLFRVDEPDSSGALDDTTVIPPVPLQPTYYSYDVLGNLTHVQQGTQSRSFVYDALSRLKQATNPESGRINYTYDDNGNLATKTDARSVVTTFTYDGLNRVLTRTYSGPAPGGTTPGVTYIYDTLGAGLNGKGRLTSVSSSVSSYSYGSYDVTGRVLTGTQTTDGQSYGMSYQYNLAGGMTSETYPSGRVVATEYDSAGRIAGVKKDTTTYYAGGAPGTANAMSYTAHGAAATMRLGNGKWEHTNYNSRLQPEQIGLGASGTDSGTLRLDYSYGTTNNNGNVQTQRIVITGSLDVTQNYTYDELNRLKTANESSGANWSQTYDYDRFGNRWVSASTGYTLNSLTPTTQSAFNAANNKVFASQYDAAGNQTADVQGRTFEYDGENRQTKFNTTAGQYFYDGDGHRVKKIDNTGATIFVYNAGGQLIAEYHNDPVPTPAGGGGTSYLTSDHLGSTRVVTKADGTVKARYDYLPFGEELGAGVGPRTTAMGYGAADSTKQKFTQKERDSESGLDYFLARYYSSAQGRFVSADPHNIVLEAQATAEGSPQKAKAQFINYLAAPQQWNRYTYVANNPLVYIDPIGEILELNGTEEERRRSFERIKDLVGAKGASTLYIRKENGRYFVESNDPGKLDASSVFGVVVNYLISAATRVQFRVSQYSITEDAEGNRIDLFERGGGYTRGFISKSGEFFVQMIADVNAARLAERAARLNDALGDDGKPLVYNLAGTFFNDIGDAHEFGHGRYIVVNQSSFQNPRGFWQKHGLTKGELHEESNSASVDYENWARERHGLHKRTSH